MRRLIHKDQLNDNLVGKVVMYASDDYVIEEVLPDGDIKIREFGAEVSEEYMQTVYYTGLILLDGQSPPTITRYFQILLKETENGDAPYISHPSERADGFDHIDPSFLVLEKPRKATITLTDDEIHKIAMYYLNL